MTKELKTQFLANNFITIHQTPDGAVRVFQKDFKSDVIKERKVYPSTTYHKCGTKLTYMLVNLYDFENQKWTNLPIQRLVYISFKGDIPSGYDVDHIDNDTLNNLPSNLQILTRKDNLAKRGKYAPEAFITTPIYCIENQQKFNNISSASKTLDITEYETSEND